MKYSRLMAVLILILVVSPILPARPVTAVQPYSEKITGYVAGSSALWFMSFNGINATAPAVGAVEAIQGVNSYNLTALETTGWTSDFQVFGPNGYNLIPVPFLPSQGVFLTVDAVSYSNAAAAAAAFNSYLLSSFVSLSNGTESYAFYSPLSFSDIMPSTLLSLLPTGAEGFASAISASAFVSLKSPIVVFSGQRGTNGFTHILMLGSIATNALDASSRPSILSYFGTSLVSIGASNKSTSSSIEFHFLDGTVNSTDRAALSNNLAGSGFYSLILGHGSKIRILNVTVVQQPVQLNAQRLVDTGVLKQGQNISVTISLTNPSTTTALTTATISDDWWKGYGFFKLVHGDSTIAPQIIKAGNSSTPTYVLQYTGVATQQLTIPALSVGYTFKVGAASFKGHATLNPALLWLGADEPVVYAYAVPTSVSGAPVGSTLRFNVVAKNVGTRAASSVVVAGQPEQGLAADGGSVTVSVLLSAQSLTGTNTTQTYTVSYSTPENHTVSVVTNPVPVIFSHSSMKLGLATLTTSASIATLKSGLTNLTITFAASNQGPSNVTSFVARGQLPAGLSCGTIKGTALACSGSGLTLTYSRLNPQATQQASMEFDLATHVNYIFAPVHYQESTSGFNLTGESNAVAVPSGLVMTKQFTPQALFGGMSSNVAVNALNSGPFDVYNATVQSSADSFDTIPGSSAVNAGSSHALAPGANLTFSYTIVATSAHGNLTASAVTAKVFFGGTPYSLSAAGPIVRVYQPISVSIQTSPASPTEGRAFSIGVTLQNPSGVTVSNVLFTLPIPASVSLSAFQNAALSGSNLTVSVSQLAPHQTYRANATAQASSGVTVLFSSGRLTFAYSGITLKGSIPAKDIVVGEDVLTRYTLPAILVLVALFATAFYVRRKAAPIAPASQQ